MLRTASVISIHTRRPLVLPAEPEHYPEPDHGDASTALGIVLIGLYGFACFCIGVAVALLRLL